MLTLEIRDLVKVSNIEDTAIEEAIDKVCSYRPTAYWFIKRRWKDYDGVHFFRNSIFPVGLMERVTKVLKDRGIEHQIIDSRTPPRGVTYSENGHIDLRPYQERALSAFASKGQVGIINAATGSGKTIIGIELIKRLKVPTIIYVPTQTLLYQWQKEINSFIKEGCGLIGDGKCLIKPITVAMYQTVAKVLADSFYSKYVKDEWKMDDDDTEVKGKEDLILSFIRSAGLVIFDEVHVVGAKTYVNVAINTYAQYRLGLSATSLMRPDGANLAVIAGCGEPCVDITTSELIKEGYLSPLVVKVVTLSEMDEQKKDKKKDGIQEYNKIKKDYIHVGGRNERIYEQTKLLLDEDRTVLVLVSEIAHGRALKVLFEQKLNKPVLFIHGSTTAKKRMKVIDQLKARQERVIITTSIFEYGLDVPILSGLVIASPSKSMIRTIQRVGRILRKHPDKVNAKIVDFDDIKADYFREHFLERMKFYVSEPEFMLEYDGGDPKIVKLVQRPKELKEFLFEWEKGLR